MSNRQEYTEGIIVRSLETSPDLSIDLATAQEVARTIFRDLDVRCMLAGTAVDDTVFIERPIGEPPYGPQLKGMSRFEPTYWKFVEALGEEYTTEGLTVAALAKRHQLAPRTMHSVIAAWTALSRNNTRTDRTAAKNNTRQSRGPYKDAVEYMQDLRAAIFENDIKATARPHYNDQIEPLVVAGQVQTERDIERLRTLLASGNDIEGLEEIINLYSAHMSRLLGQLGGAALTLKNNYYTPGFANILEDTPLRQKVIRYMHRNHRQLIWELAGRKLENLNPTEIACTFSLYHSAEELNKLREEYKSLGTYVVDFTVVNSPRKTHSVLEDVRQNYQKLKNIERFEVLGDHVIKEIAITNPSDPEQAADDALETFKKAIADPENSIFSEGDIRNLMGKSSVTLESKLEQARNKVNELKNIDTYKKLGISFIARQTLKRPNTIKAHLDKVAEQLNVVVSEPRFVRFGTPTILMLIEANPAEAHTIMATAADLLERAEEDPDCQKFGAFYVARPKVLRDKDPFKKFKACIAEYEKMRMMHEYADVSDDDLKEIVLSSEI